MWREAALGEELGQRPAGELLDDVALHVDGDAAMLQGARLLPERNPGKLVDHGLQRGVG
jgi:hypothetical protein